jgi:hypothetical protein
LTNKVYLEYKRIQKLTTQKSPNHRTMKNQLSKTALKGAAMLQTAGPVAVGNL